MPEYVIKAVFEHSYFFTVKAKDYAEAMDIIKEAGMESSDKRILNEGDGMFGDLIKIESVRKAVKNQRLIDILKDKDTMIYG